MDAGDSTRRGPREWLGRSYTLVEDVVYLGLGILLAAIVLLLLFGMFVDFSRALPTWSASHGVADLLDRILLTLLIVELLYTVQVSFKTHGLRAEPFLLVGLISAIRRVLLLTAELAEHKQALPQLLLAELAVLAFLILVLALALILVRRTRASDQPPRSD